MPPYRRKGYKRSYGRSRSTSRRRRPMGGTFMKRAKTRAYANLRTGGLLAIERKFLDLGYLPTGLTNGGTGVGNNVVSTFAPAILGPTVMRAATGTIYNPVAPVALNVVGQDDTGSGRDGRQIINDSIHIRGEVHLSGADGLGGFNGNVAPYGCVINLVLVLDTQTNGGTPSGASVFVNPGDFTANGQRTGQAPFVNLSNSKRFRILKHIRRVLLPSIGWVEAGVTQHGIGNFVFSMDVPLKQMKTNFVSDAPYTNGSAPTNASIGDNGLFLFGWTNQTANAAIISFNSRLRFRG